jgi:hypothetical protein
MPRRIEIELTSSRDDDTWTWRAAGAKEPRGTVATSVVGPAAKVGDVLKVEAEFFVDGIEITSVVPTKSAREEAQRLELLGSSRDEPLVTTTLATRTRDDRRPRRDGDRRERRDGDRREGPREGGDRPGRKKEGEGRSDREGDNRRPRPDRARKPRPETPPVPVIERPKAKRLRPAKTHRAALLESLPEEQRPIAEQVVLGGLPAVRQAIEKQNAERTAAGEAAITAGPLLEVAEKLVPKVRAAEWRDRAEAAQKDLEVLDLRDLRSVVSAADSGTKDEEARELARVLKEGLAARVDAEHALWLTELKATLEVGRIVRALRLSSRPPKAGAPLPPDVAEQLTEQASGALTADAAAERWVAVLDALAFAPVRDKVIPASLPADLHEDVKATIARLATRIPKVAHIFEIEPDRNAPRPKIERRKAKPKIPPKPALPKDQDPASEPVATDEPATAPATEAEPTTEPGATADTEPEPTAEAEPEAAAEPSAEAEAPEPAVEAAEPEAEAPDAATAAEATDAEARTPEA